MTFFQKDTPSFLSAHSFYLTGMTKLFKHGGLATYDLATETSRNIVAEAAEGIRGANALKATIFHSSLKGG